MANRPTTEDYATRIDCVLDRAGTRAARVGELVAAYFDHEKAFAGDIFNTLGTNEVNEVGIADLLAVTTLDLGFPAVAVRRLLSRDDRARITGQLSDITAVHALWEAPLDDLERATKLWECLQKYVGVGPSRAGKLLARKRPRLIPIVDSVVKATLKFPRNLYWITLRDCLKDEERRACIEALRPAGLTSEVTTLRLLDVALWMQFSGSRNAREARRGVGLKEEPPHVPS